MQKQDHKPCHDCVHDLEVHHYDSALDDHDYLQWVQYVRTSLKGRKLSHIESGPPRDDPKFEAWDDEDSLIMAWL
ncbi:hypothetical protein CR513_57067, partial [Mucuna pruriens]